MRPNPAMQHRLVSVVPDLGVDKALVVVPGGGADHALALALVRPPEAGAGADVMRAGPTVETAMVPSGGVMARTVMAAMVLLHRTVSTASCGSPAAVMRVMLTAQRSGDLGSSGRREMVPGVPVLDQMTTVMAVFQGSGDLGSSSSGEVMPLVVFALQGSGDLRSGGSGEVVPDVMAPLEFCRDLRSRGG